MASDAIQEPETVDEEPDDGSSGTYATMVIPVASTILLTTLFFFFAGPDATVELLTTAVVTATVLGKFAVLRGLHDEGLFDSPFKVAFLIIYLDLLVASIAVYNIRLLHAIPRFGAKIQKLQDNGASILERNPWMRKVTFLGIIGFVMFPLSGTGAIGGALFGRLLGLTRARTMVGIAMGAVIGSFLMASLAQLFGDQMQNLQGNPVFMVGGILVVGGVVYWLYRRAKSHG